MKINQMTDAELLQKIMDVLQDDTESGVNPEDTIKKLLELVEGY